MKRNIFILLFIIVSIMLIHAQNSLTITDHIATNCKVEKIRENSKVLFKGGFPLSAGVYFTADIYKISTEIYTPVGAKYVVSNSNIGRLGWGGETPNIQQTAIMSESIDNGNGIRLYTFVYHIKAAMFAVMNEYYPCRPEEIQLGYAIVSEGGSVSPPSSRGPSSGDSRGPSSGDSRGPSSGSSSRR